MKEANEGWGEINLWSWCYLLPSYEEVEMTGGDEMKGWERERATETYKALKCLSSSEKPQLVNPKQFYLVVTEQI